jgi:hypothetical protein
LIPGLIKSKKSFLWPNVFIIRGAEESEQNGFFMCIREKGTPIPTPGLSYSTALKNFCRMDFLIRQRTKKSIDPKDEIAIHAGILHPEIL